jgi:sugar phosphate isomerase/epimerase
MAGLFFIWQGGLMRIGTLCPLADVPLMHQAIAAGFEFIEIVAGAEALPPHAPPPEVPLIWQAFADLPAAHPSAHIREAVLQDWLAHLNVAAECGALLLVVQFQPASLLRDKADTQQMVDHYAKLLNPLTEAARALNVQAVLRMSPQNNKQLEALRALVRMVPGLGIALDVAYAHHGVVKNLSGEYLWDSDIAPRLAHLYVSDTHGRDPSLRLPLGTAGDAGPDWPRLVSQLRERYNASITIDIGNAAPEYLNLSRETWLNWWNQA